MPSPEEPTVVPVGEPATDAATSAAPAATAPPESDSEPSEAASPTPSEELPIGGEGAEAEHGRAVERDLEELAAKAEKADEYLELAQRTKADFENYRKRAARDASVAQERGIAKLAKELLPAIDNLDRALQAADTFAAGSPEE